ncbi:DUF3027 domain-containing protein [Streptomyces sp. NBC_01789]|uniref:DUF3027 domain-containing protein n=1 Tax=Streptomyces sp. NBC_01789 TaxID=2975941 RepID=UPI00225692C9|nr:DUF3027 domain-containing protein [Streptomyces sp. NBC_01789]MCX4451369.1 DUF3027 domain-containing protein [Streptomyces sp. NBC_01789]
MQIQQEGGEQMAPDGLRADDEVHERWSRLLNRTTRGPGYRDEWFDEQCGGCKFWIALSGEIGLDWGACARADSPFDGQVRFEHDGCERFSARADGTFG